MILLSRNSRLLFGVIVVGMIFAVTAAGADFSLKYDGRVIHGKDSMNVDPHLRISVEQVEYQDFNASEWVLWFENQSNEKSGVLSDILDCDSLIELPPFNPGFCGNVSVPGERCVYTMKGCVDGWKYSCEDQESSTEFAAIPHYFRQVGQGPVAVCSFGGRPSDREAPFFDISEKGYGAVVALGWTGDWKASFSNEIAGVRVKAGLKNARFYLKPGERVRTCRVLVMRYGAEEDKSNKFRRLIRRYFSHTTGKPFVRKGIFAYELWGGLPSEEMVRRIEKVKARGMGFEDYWVDAGWYGDCKESADPYTGDWYLFTGDWYMSPRSHPDGMKTVGAAAKGAGGGIMLWFEPERVVDTSAFVKTHSEWLLGKGKQRLLYYGIPEARRHVVDIVCGYASQVGFSCYRQDFNISPDSLFESADEPDRRGITEIRHVLGMYEVWDEMLRRNPGMLIDNCSSGGRRLDLETLRRAVFFFRSDYQCGFNANPDVVQAHNAALSLWLPYSGCTTKRSDLYSLRSSYASSYGVAYWNGVRQEEDKVDWEAAKKSHDEYLRIRDFFSFDFYNHGSSTMDTSAWAIWQYHDSETGKGVVLAFRRAEASCDRAVVNLKGICADARIRYEEIDSDSFRESDRNLEIVLPERRSSTIIIYSTSKNDAKK